MGKFDIWGSIPRKALPEIACDTAIVVPERNLCYDYIRKQRQRITNELTQLKMGKSHRVSSMRKSGRKEEIMKNRNRKKNKIGKLKRGLTNLNSVL